MDKRVILAVAGAGKTYELCKAININEKNLILAFTHENIKNIINGLLSQYGIVPEKTRVLTFDSFVYRYMVNPYLPSIKEFYNESNCKIKGITTENPPAPAIEYEKGKYRSNPYYAKKEFFSHYYNNEGKLFISYIPDLLLSVKRRKVDLIERICQNINRFFDYVYIDEFQDFRENRYKLLIKMTKHLNNILLVGDYYQHSVSGVNNSGVPFSLKKKNISYDDFILKLKSENFKVDNSSMTKSRRCSREVADFVNMKLQIDFASYDEHDGKVIIIDNLDNAKRILNDDSIVKLVYDGANTKNFRTINWSYSKGDTYDDVCVILNKNLDNLIEDKFDCSILKTQTRNKLYVALTRSKRNLYILTYKIYQSLYK